MSDKGLPFAIIILVCIHFLISCGQNEDTDPSTPATPGRVAYQGALSYSLKNMMSVNDRSTFVKILDTGEQTRTVYDGRIEGRITLTMFSFTAHFDDNVTIIFLVNKEIDYNRSLELSQEYAMHIGRLPAVLRKGTHFVVVHAEKGTPRGGQIVIAPNLGSILIHVDTFKNAIDNGRIEELLIHETTHAAIDAKLNGTSGWLHSQRTDNSFISDYAYRNPTREDLAETMIAYLGQKFFQESLGSSNFNRIREVIPNRIAYLDGLNLDLYPLEN